MATVDLNRLTLVFLLRFCGYFLILSSIAGISITFLPVAKATTSYYFNQAKGVQYTVEKPISKQLKEIELPSKLPKVVINPVDRKFGIVIPKINANSKVVANVDAGNESEYRKALKEGVAHAAGTAYPGEIGNTFLFAHSAGNFWEVSQYNAVFFLLGELNPGDEIFVFFNGQRFDYQVTSKTIVDPDQVQFLNTQTNFSQLTLQTCWPPGTALKRLLVLARLKKN